MEQNYYSNGKLLLTGEYVVLDGAKALAVPTKFGQLLNIKQGTNKQFKWTSLGENRSGNGKISVSREFDVFELFGKVMLGSSQKDFMSF